MKKPKRRKYNLATGIIHKLRANEISRKGFFKIQESCLIKLNSDLISWLNWIVDEKVKNKKNRIVRIYDLIQYSDKFTKILKGGLKKNE